MINSSTMMWTLDNIFFFFLNVRLCVGRAEPSERVMRENRQQRTQRPSGEQKCFILLFFCLLARAADCASARARLSVPTMRCRLALDSPPNPPLQKHCRSYLFSPLPLKKAFAKDAILQFALLTGRRVSSSWHECQLMKYSVCNQSHCCGVKDIGSNWKVAYKTQTKNIPIL